MKSFLTYWLIAAAAVFPVRGEAPRELVLSGMAVQLRGVSEPMALPARQLLEKQLTLSGDKTASPPLADDLAFFLQQRYLQSGYPKALVDWHLAGGGILLEAREGPLRTVGTITFSGVEPEQAEELRPYLTRQTREREGRLNKVLPFVEADLEAGLGLVVRKLQADGYLAAAAAAPVFTEPAGSGAVGISVALTPGPLSVFGTITVEGDASSLSKSAFGKIEGLTGQPFSEVRLENVRKEAKGDLQGRGLLAAEVTAAVREAGAQGGRIPAVLRVVPGAVFKVQDVRTDRTLSRGAQRVADAVFHAATGQRYAPEALDLLHRRSMDTGIFSRLEVEPQRLGPDTLSLVVTGEEAKPKTLGFFGGYETFYGPIAGIEARHVNFLNSGDAVGLRAELRGTGAGGSLLWTDPAVFGSRNALNVALGLETFTFKDYSRTSLSLRGSLTRRIDRHITAEAFSAISLNSMDTTVLTAEELGPDKYETLTAGGRLTLDYRDNPLNPQAGWLAGAAFEGGVDQGGEETIGYGRTDLNVAWYYPMGPSWRLALGARASAIRSSGSQGELPIDLRLFNGGATTVRSFAEREMGVDSRKGSTPLGGTSITALNAEVSYEVIPNLEVAGFVDAGSVSRQDDGLFRMDDLRYGVGMGLRYQLPVGPLRLDYGFNPNRKSGEAVGALHVTFGFAF
jgi:outer membrane protein insertion porin family